MKLQKGILHKSFKKARVQILCGRNDEFEVGKSDPEPCKKTQ